MKKARSPAGHPPIHQERKRTDSVSLPLQEHTVAQRDRLAYIDLRLRFLGELRRTDIVERFGIQQAAASHDISLYKRVRPDNLFYDASRKRYYAGEPFRPLFDFPPQRVLAWLTQDFGDGEPAPIRSEVAAELSAHLSDPDLDVLSAVTRAIYGGRPLAVEYHSYSSGRTRRVIAPFALIDTGLRWHVRAFDRKSQTFRDFVLTRMRAPRVLDEPVAEHERWDKDAQWTRWVDLDLVPHPDHPRPEVTALDYGMTDGVLRRRVRAAFAGYFLRKWNVDCSPDHRLRGPEYRLWLKDPMVLYGVENAVLAPGYQGRYVQAVQEAGET